MNGVVVGIKALLLIVGVLHLVTRGESAIDDVTHRYCLICANHTMCRFPYDDPGRNCVDIENGDLDDEEIRWILHWHNSFRNNVTKSWKNPDTWPSARDMMQVFWDEELALIARRWVLQCNIHDKDECRNVKRFFVMQNVNALDLEEAGNHSALERLEFHMRTWFDQLDFSGRASEYSMTTKRNSAGLATSTLTRMGCGRATYDVDLHEGKQLSRVEALVCNYGPIFDVALLETPFGVSRCATPSFQYPELCITGTRDRGGGGRASFPDARRREGVATIAVCGKRCYWCYRCCTIRLSFPRDAPAVLLSHPLLDTSFPSI